MPIDASIPLRTEAPQVANPFQVFGQAMSLKSAMDHGQLQQANMERIRIDNERDQRSIKASETLGKLISQNMRPNDAGDVEVDHDPIIKGLADAGYGIEAQKYDTTRRADVAAALEAHKKKLEGVSQQHKMLGSLLATIPAVEWNNPDPLVRDGQAKAAQAAASMALDKALQNGLVKREEAGKFAAALQAGYSHEIEATLQQVAKYGTDADKQHEQALKLIEENRKRFLFDPQLASATSEAEHKALAAAAQSVRTVTNQVQLDAWRSSQPRNIQGMLPRQWTPETVNQVRGLVVTPAQEQATDDRKEARDAMAAYREDSLKLRNDTHNESMMLRRENAAKEKGQTSNSKAVDVRAMRREFNTTQDEEDSLHNLTSKLGNALNSETLQFYVDDKGKVIPIAKAAGEEEKSVIELRTEMQDRLKLLRGKLHRVVDAKYDLMEGMGASPSVPRSKVHEELDKGPVASPASPTAPRATPPATAAQPVKPASAPPAAATAAKSTGPVRVTAPDGTVLTFPSQQKADDFKKKARIK